ncbi:MAG: helix-turn-helix domain-containing protein [Pseudomonadota bacterium]|jgi:DNA-binding transcriptional regulator YiaG
MPNIASVLKEEIGRVARKEIRAEVASLQKTVASQRSQLAALRRQIQALEKAVKSQNRARKASVAEPAKSEGEDAGVSRRFSAERLAAQRKKLELSAADFAKLIGVSALSVYKWESGKTRPRDKQIAAIATVRGLGKREAAQRLEMLAAAA